MPLLFMTCKRAQAVWQCSQSGESQPSGFWGYMPAKARHSFKQTQSGAWFDSMVLTGGDGVRFPVGEWARGVSRKPKGHGLAVRQTLPTAFVFLLPNNRITKTDTGVTH